MKPVVIVKTYKKWSTGGWMPVVLEVYKVVYHDVNDEIKIHQFMSSDSALAFVRRKFDNVQVKFYDATGWINEETVAPQEALERDAGS